MCGIAGKVNFKKAQKVSIEEIQALTCCLSHRGPEDGGVKLLQNVALGHRRLAIIDLSPKGHQPMAYKRNRYWISFNGEIYNYQEIKDDLLRKGYTFYTNSDTEVILASYDCYGTKCLKYFRGMFAFAIYDTKTQLLFAARDRLGKKPFKYFVDQNCFIFASEIKALFTQKEVPKLPDISALKQYTYWGFVPSPKTGFKNIFKLPAGHYLILKNDTVTIHRYWDYQPIEDSSITEKEAKETIRNLVEESVKLRMVSDVPVGAFLSGGIDSCVVVGLMSKYSHKPINTYTIGFKNWSGDEIKPARISAKYHHTNHHEIYIQPNIKKEIAEVVASYDEPFGDVSAVPSLSISKAASKHLKVVLNGDGGDENFIGYSNYLTFLQTEKFSLFNPLAWLLYATTSYLPAQAITSPYYNRMRRISHLLSKNPVAAYSDYVRGYLNLVNFSDLFLADPLIPELEFSTFLSSKKATNNLSAILHQDLHNILPDGLMNKMDIASMHYGLESRSPLLDHKLVEYMAKVPLDIKLKHGPKSLFKETFDDLIPPEIRNLPKQGFVMPVQQWLNKDLKYLVDNELKDKDNALYTFLSYQTIQKIIDLSTTTNMDYSFIIWRLLILSLWWKYHFSSISA